MFSKALTKTIFTSIALGAIAVTANAADFNRPNLDLGSQKPAAQAVDLTQHKRSTALHIAQQYEQLKPVLAAHISTDNLNLSLEMLQQNPQLDLSEFVFFQQEVHKVKGHSSEVKGLVELRLADPSMVEALTAGVSPLFAFEPKGDEASWSFVEAFDSQGNTHLLDVNTLPKQPVLVVDINSRNDMQAGIAQMKAVFAKMNVAPQTTEKAPIQTNAVLETSQLKKISVNDDQEPWISGKAEMYVIVTGIDSSRDDPLLDIVDMPYLDHKDTNYYPDQIVIFWDRYRWNAADMIIMEHDDNTNYQELAIQLANTAGDIMAIIPDPTVQGLAVLGKLTAELIKAMPSSWFSNDDDYVDVFYTLMKNYTYTNKYGASANAKINLSPLNLYN